MTDRTKATEPSAQMVARKVAEYLKDFHPGGISVEVDPGGVQRGEFSWRVRVRPSEEPSKLFEYYEALADVEMRLEEHEHLNVWFVTADPIHQQPVEGRPPSIEETTPTAHSVQRRTRQPKAAK